MRDWIAPSPPAGTCTRPDSALNNRIIMQFPPCPQRCRQPWAGTCGKSLTRRDRQPARSWEKEACARRGTPGQNPQGTCQGVPPKAPSAPLPRLPLPGKIPTRIIPRPDRHAGADFQSRKNGRSEDHGPSPTGPVAPCLVPAGPAAKGLPPQPRAKNRISGD